MATTNRAGVVRRLVREREAAEYLACSVRTLRTWRALGRIPTVRMGEGSRTVRFDLKDLDRAIEAGKEGT